MDDMILERNELSGVLNRIRQMKKTIVFTNGCFDIIHTGHVQYLAQAKMAGDVLIVGLNSDASVRLIKGSKRPINRQQDRAEVLAALKSVDYITVFDEPDPAKLIQTVKPNVLVKGADWPEENIIGGDFVKKHGGKIVRVPLSPGASTSNIISRIIERYGRN